MRALMSKRASQVALGADTARWRGSPAEIARHGADAGEADVRARAATAFAADRSGQLLSPEQQRQMRAAQTGRGGAPGGRGRGAGLAYQRRGRLSRRVAAPSE